MTERADVPAGIQAGADRSPASADPLLATDSPRRVRARQGLLAGLALAVLAGVIVFERGTLAESLHVLARLNWGWFLLALAAELISLVELRAQPPGADAGQPSPAGFAAVSVITYAANALSISIPFAGAELAVVFSYRQFRRHGAEAAATGWMLADVGHLLHLRAGRTARHRGAGRVGVAGQRGWFPGRRRVHRAGRRRAARAALRARPPAPAPGHCRCGQGVPPSGRGPGPGGRRPGGVPGPGGEPAAARAEVRRGVRPGPAELGRRLRGAGLRDQGHRRAGPLAQPAAGLRGRSGRGRHRDHAGRLRAGGTGPDRRPDRGWAAPVVGAGRRAGLPADQLLADPRGGVGADGGARASPGWPSRCTGRAFRQPVR